jgi:hypothetical protein
LATEPEFSGILDAASRAGRTQAGSALATKLHSVRVVGLALKAFHAGLPGLALQRVVDVRPDF